MPRRAIPLAQLARGDQAVMHTADLTPDEAAVLSAMGLRPECKLRVCRVGSPCIVAVGEGASMCRIGLSPELAGAVLVTPER